MSRILHKILHKAGSVQHGMLRYHKGDQKYSLPARIGAQETTLHCLLQPGEEGHAFLDRDVSLVQRHHNDYLYIQGRVTGESCQPSARIIALEIRKACWFTRHTKGCLSWLREKYVYETPREEIDLAS